MREMNRRGIASAERARPEPFEVFTRPRRSLLVRLAGLVVRLRAELITATASLWGWSALVEWVAPSLLGLVVGVVVLAGAAWHRSRRFVVRRALAVLTRHRLRAVFVQRRVMNWSGSLPLLLWSRPTPVGERVWLLLRAGIDAGDITHNLSHVASGCFAADARVTAHPRITTLAVVDVVRRDPLGGSAVGSALGSPATAVRRLQAIPALPVGGGRSA